MTDKCNERERPKAKMAFFHLAYLPLASHRGKTKRVEMK